MNRPLDFPDQAALCADVIQAGTGHVPVPLQRLAGARVLWVNLDEAHADPAWAGMAGNMARYERHLLDACAFAVAADGARADATGIADRYGGNNIGSNGGSGRAAFIGAYHVKGIGRTPLVGHGVDAAHASGGAYLEECVRESVFAEVVARDFPYGSVRTLAIIATGRVQVWATDAGPKTEQCCLLVRRAFLRPAHLERAVRLRGADPRAGSVDAERVRLTLRRLAAALGGLDAVQDALLIALGRWAGQLACSYVQCLPHGGVSSSNVCIDGRLVDFGAMAAVPSLARYWVASGEHPSGEEYKDILDTVNSLTCAFRFTLGVGEPARAWRTRAIEHVLASYGQELHAQVLAMLGFDARECAAVRASPAYPLVRRLLDAELARWRRKVLAIFDGTPWDREHMPPEDDLQRLAARVLDLAGAAVVAGGAAGDAEAVRRAAERQRRTAPRPRLGREHSKAECYARLDGAAAPAAPGAVGALIDELVAGQARAGAAS
jgi:hypothetical protein